MPWKLKSIEPSTRSGKKWMANFYDATNEKKKTVHFGQKGARDYTTIADPKEALDARTAYRSRHAKDLKTGDPLAPGFLSMYVLWGTSRFMGTNISEYKKLFNL
jgi:hypothetical protein